MLFAPVFIDPVIVVRGWRFVPSFVVYDDFLFGALFIRHGYCHYYFGDYFDDRYDRLGFVAWFDFRIGRFGYDPLFGYYRRHFDSDRRWEGNLHRLYADRRSGAAPRPPRTLDLQHTLMQNITNKTVKVGDVKTVTALTPLAKVDPKVVKLEAVSKAQIAQEQKAGERLHELANHRREVEAKVISEGVPDRHTDPSKSIKLDLPIPSTTFKGSTEIKTIAPPALADFAQARAGGPTAAAQTGCDAAATAAAQEGTASVPQERRLPQETSTPGARGPSTIRNDAGGATARSYNDSQTSRMTARQMHQSAARARTGCAAG